MTDPLSPYSRHLVESARRAHQPDVATKRRVRRSLDARLAAVAVLGGSTLLGTLGKAMGVTLLTAGVVTGGVMVVKSRQADPAVPASVRHAAKPPAKHALAPVTAPASSLQQELTLLNEAQAALRGHDPQHALALLDRHASEFPEGFMMQERQAARALALCELGRIDEARALARAFIQTWPGSPLISRMNELCPSQRPGSGALPRGR